MYTKYFRVLLLARVLIQYSSMILILYSTRVVLCIASMHTYYSRVGVGITKFVSIITRVVILEY